MIQLKTSLERDLDHLKTRSLETSEQRKKQIAHLEQVIQFTRQENETLRQKFLKSYESSVQDKALRSSGEIEIRKLKSQMQDLQTLVSVLDSGNQTLLKEQAKLTTDSETEIGRLNDLLTEKTRRMEVLEKELQKTSQDESRSRATANQSTNRIRELVLRTERLEAELLDEKSRSEVLENLLRQKREDNERLIKLNDELTEKLLCDQNSLSSYSKKTQALKAFVENEPGKSGSEFDDESAKDDEGLVFERNRIAQKTNIS